MMGTNLCIGTTIRGRSSSYLIVDMTFPSTFKAESTTMVSKSIRLPDNTILSVTVFGRTERPEMYILSAISCNVLLSEGLVDFSWEIYGDPKCAACWLFLINNNFFTSVYF
jgi:hypothetical protein